VARLFRNLKKLPDDFSVWFNIADDNTEHGEKQKPHFLIVWQDRCAYLLHIASTSQELADSAIYGDFFSAQNNITPDTLNHEERSIISSFTQSLAKPQHFPITPILVFPNVKTGTLDTISAETGTQDGILFLGKQQLVPDKLAEFLISHAPQKMSQPQLIELRHRFTPEISVPREFSPLAIQRTLPTATLTPLLLDVDQEWCVKNNLYLPEEGEKIANSPLPSDDSEVHKISSQLVTGVAGSGKSLILLYRALLNARLAPQAKVLVLTHNRPIKNELQKRFDSLGQKKYNITWSTFFQWARGQLTKEEWNPHKEIIFPDKALKIIDTIARTIPENTLTPDFLLDEIGFIQDLGINLLDQYLSTPRSGRGRRLNESQRRHTWSIFKQYREHLIANDITDWHHIASRFHRKAMSGNCSFPAYHCILIDEAQFFAKSWFDIVRKALIPGGQLFLAADPTQGFLKRKQSWISSGIEVRGRTTKLAKSYRNSREILAFATRFYKQRQDLTHTTDLPDDALNLLSCDEILQAKPTGIDPVIIPTQNPQEAHQRLIAELEEIQHSRQPKHHIPILILQADSRLQKKLLQSLRKQLPELYFHEAKDSPAPPHTFAQVATLNAATGLEAPIVFLLGVDTLLEKENSPLLNDEERLELITSHTQKLYMGFTRAAQRLIIFSKRLQI